MNSDIEQWDITKRRGRVGWRCNDWRG